MAAATICSGQIAAGDAKRGGPEKRRRWRREEKQPCCTSMLDEFHHGAASFRRDKSFTLEGDDLFHQRGAGNRAGLVGVDQHLQPGTSVHVDSKMFAVSPRS